MVKNRWLLVGGALALVAVSLLSVLATVLIMERMSGSGLNQLPEDLEVGYAMEGVTIIDDAEALSELVQQMEDSRVTVGIQWQNDLFSKNGRDFTCFLGNPERNGKDMVISVYADSEHKEVLYASKLLRPGTALERITLNNRLDPGVHELGVAFSLVEANSRGIQKVIGSQVFALTFHVEE